MPQLPTLTTILHQANILVTATRWLPKEVGVPLIPQTLATQIPIEAPLPLPTVQLCLNMITKFDLIMILRDTIRLLRCLLPRTLMAK